MGQMAASERQFAPYLEKIRGLEFVKALDFSAERNPHEDRGIDGKLRIRTPKGTFNFLVEQKSSYLDRSLLNAFIAQAKHQTESAPTPSHSLCTLRSSPFCRTPCGLRNKLPRPRWQHAPHSREQLFPHRSRQQRISTSRESASLGAARIQLLFTFAADQNAGDSTVRELAETSGLSKSSVARLREELVEEQILRKTARGYEVRDKKELQQILLAGYENTLRPKLFINRCRAAESTSEQLLPRLKDVLGALAMRWSRDWSRCGVSAAALLQGTRDPALH